MNSKIFPWYNVYKIENKVGNEIESGCESESYVTVVIGNKIEVETIL